MKREHLERVLVFLKFWPFILDFATSYIKLHKVECPKKQATEYVEAAMAKGTKKDLVC